MAQPMALSEPDAEPTFDSGLPPRAEKTLQQKKAACAKLIVLLMHDSNVADVTKPSIMTQMDWDIMQACLHASLAVLNQPDDTFASEETMQKLAWFHYMHCLAINCVHEEHQLRIPERYSGFLKLGATHVPLIEALRTLHEQ